MFPGIRPLLLIAALTSAFVARGEDADAQHARIKAIHHSVSLSETERKSALRAAYPPDSLLPRETLHRMSEAELRTRFDTVDGVMYIVADPRYLRDMYALDDELHDRGVETTKEDKRLYGALVQLRRFREARAFASNKAGTFEALPALHTENDEPSRSLRYMALANDGTSLDLKPVAWNDDYTVIVVSHPLCHFSRRASRQIPDQPDLAKLLAGHALWLEPPSRTLDTRATLDWQAEAPDTHIGLMYAASDWAMFSSLATPTFYVFKGRTLVGKKSGWGGPEDGPELQALIEKALPNESSR